VITDFDTPVPSSPSLKPQATTTKQADKKPTQVSENPNSIDVSSTLKPLPPPRVNLEQPIEITDSEPSQRQSPVSVTTTTTSTSRSPTIFYSPPLSPTISHSSSPSSSSPRTTYKLDQDGYYSQSQSQSQAMINLVETEKINQFHKARQLSLSNITDQFRSGFLDRNFQTIPPPNYIGGSPPRSPPSNVNNSVWSPRPQSKPVKLVRPPPSHGSGGGESTNGRSAVTTTVPLLTTTTTKVVSAVTTLRESGILPPSFNPRNPPQNQNLVATTTTNGLTRQQQSGGGGGGGGGGGDSKSPRIKSVSESNVVKTLSSSSSPSNTKESLAPPSNPHPGVIETVRASFFSVFIRAKPF